MKRGKLGIRLAFYAILAFVLALLKQPLLCGLLLGFVLILEEDQWAARQVLQGFMLSLVVFFFMDLASTFTSFITFPFGFLFDFVTGAQRVVSLLAYAASAVFAILGIVRTARDQEANLPLFSNLAYYAFGQQKPQPVKQAYPPQGYGPPMPPMPGQQAAPFQGQAGGVAVPPGGATAYQPPVQPYPAAPYVDPNPTAQLPTIPVQPEQPAPQPAQAQPPMQQPPQQL